MASSHQDTETPNTLNLLSSSSEASGFHNDSLLRELSLPQNFVVSVIDVALVLFLAAYHICLLTNVHILSRLIVGQKLWFFLSDNASYQLPQSHLNGTCQSLSYGDACCQCYPDLLAASNAD